MSIVTPCRECTNRTIGCHAHCKEYRRFVDENDKLKKEKRKINSAYRAKEPSLRTTARLFKDIKKGR